MGAPITGYFLRMIVNLRNNKEAYFFSGALPNDFSRSLNDAIKAIPDLTVDDIIYAEIFSSQFANVSDSGQYFLTKSTGTPSRGFVDGNDSGRAIQGVTTDFGQTPTSIFYSKILKYGGDLSPV